MDCDGLSTEESEEGEKVASSSFVEVLRRERSIRRDYELQVSTSVRVQVELVFV